MTFAPFSQEGEGPGWENFEAALLPFQIVQERAAALRATQRHVGMKVKLAH